MGFTNVAWESRSAETLARDLTGGPGPTSVGQAGAAWVRVADELANVSNDYNKVVDKVRAAFVSRGGDAAANRLDQFGQWLAAASLSAAGNGERAEQAAVAYSVAVLAMPSVAEAVQSRTTRDVMASLAAYNGAVLNGNFGEFDDAASADHADATTVMYQYEDACAEMAAVWDQPAPPDLTTSAALDAEHAKSATDGGGADGAGAATGSVGSIAVAPPPLTPFRASGPSSSGDPKDLTKAAAASTGSSAASPMGSGYGPMAALARGAAGREHQASVGAGTLDGVGEAGASLSATDAPWLPTAQTGDAPFAVSQVSWGPDTSVFDELATPAQPEAPGYADDPSPTLEQVSDRWVSPPVIGIDKRLTL